MTDLSRASGRGRVESGPADSFNQSPLGNPVRSGGAGEALQGAWGGVRAVGQCLVNCCLIALTS